MAIFPPTVRLTALAAAAWLATSAQAQNNKEPQLAETVVTATRSEARANAVVSDVTVITREQVEQSAGRTLAEVLQQYAGVQIAANGGRGKAGSVFIRGAESRHTLLLVDGVRYGSATLGIPTWNNIPLASIERIEVLKGPASSLYGADAAGGVVQIFTRRGTQDGAHPYAEVTVGSHDYRGAAAGVSGKAGQVGYSLNASGFNDGGISATNGKYAAAYNPDRDGFRQRSVDGAFDWDLTRDWTLSGGFLRSESSNYYDGSYYDSSFAAVPADNPHGRLNTFVGRLGLKGQVTRAWTTRIDYRQSRDDSKDWTVSGQSADIFKTRQDQLTWQNDIVTPVGTVVAGLERLDQRVDGTTAYEVTRRSITSVFAGINGEAAGHTWQASVRRDDNSQFGDKTTGLLGYGYQLLPSLRAHASYGTSFVAPSFNQLYYPGFSNTKLEPEKGRNGEIGLTWSAAGQELSATYFRNKIRGFITSGARPVNIPYARIEGWSLGYRGQLQDLSLYANLDLLDPRNTVTGDLLPRRARRQLTAGADYPLGAWKLGGALRVVGEREEAFFNDATYATEKKVLGGYTTADLYASYAINRDWSAQLRLNNLAGKDYETAYGYNQPGREAFLTLRWQPR